MLDLMDEWMNEWTDSCFCVFVFVFIYLVVWLVRSTCVQGGAVYIENSGSSGTFTSCNFTSNKAKEAVSLGEEGQMSECMTLRLCPPCNIFLTDSFLPPVSVYCDCYLLTAIGLHITHISNTPLLLSFFSFVALPFACTCIEGKSFCYLSSHTFSWPWLSSCRSFYESTRELHLPCGQYHDEHHHHWLSCGMHLHSNVREFECEACNVMRAWTRTAILT